VAIPLAKAIKEWETRNSKVAAEEREIMLYGGLVFDTKRSFINKLDATLASLKNCERLALSTNQIDRMAPFTGMEKLRLLSLSRNAIKKIERLEDVAETLEELWMSYNQVSSLDGLGSCSKLQVLYLGNNKITDWNELDKLAGLPSLREVLFTGNPIYDGMEKAAAKLQVIKRIPNIQKVDNDMVSPGERDAAKAL
jgi:dynein light chain 1